MHPSFIFLLALRRPRSNPDGPSQAHLCVRASAPPLNPSSSPSGSEPSPREALERTFLRVADLASASPSSSPSCPCIWCTGTGERTCAWCKGAGSRREYLHKSWEEMTEEVQDAIDNDRDVALPEKIVTRCSLCEGACVTKCPKCQGTGRGRFGKDEE